MSQYRIRTPSGDKGPFTLDQLEKLVAAQKIPLTISVIEEESGLALPLADLVVTSAVAPPPPAPPPMVAPPSQPAPPAAPSRAPRRGGASRGAPARRGNRGGSPRRGGGRAGGRGRSTPPRRSTSPLKIILIVLLVLAVIGGVAFLFLANFIGGAIRTHEEFVSRASGAYVVDFLPMYQDTEFQMMASREGIAVGSVIAELQALSREERLVPVDYADGQLVLGERSAPRETWRLTALSKQSRDVYEVILDMGDGDRMHQRAEIRGDGDIRLTPAEPGSGVRLLLEKE